MGLVAEKPKLKRVLVIEDNLINMRLFEAYLRATAPYEVLRAASGPEGLELARKHRPDLIILDIQLPWFVGYRRRPWTESRS